MIIEIEGEPIAWKRARRSGNRYFDVQKAKKNDFVLSAISKAPSFKIILKGLRVDILFQMGIPSSWTKKRQRECFKTPHEQIPDKDNLTKFVYDSLNGVFWHDDKLIFDGREKKIWHNEPKTIILIDETKENVNKYFEE